jgi:hypothetical protein
MTDRQHWEDYARTLNDLSKPQQENEPHELTRYTRYSIHRNKRSVLRQFLNEISVPYVAAGSHLSMTSILLKPAKHISGNASMDTGQVVIPPAVKVPPRVRH